MLSTPGLSGLRRTQSLLEVYESGPLTRIGFARNELPHFADDPTCRDELLAILRRSGCRRLVFELDGLRGVNSSLVALLLLPVRQGVEVTVSCPSRHLREVLRVTQVDRLLRIEDRRDETRIRGESGEEASRTVEWTPRQKRQAVSAGRRVWP